MVLQYRKTYIFKVFPILQQSPGKNVFIHTEPSRVVESQAVIRNRRDNGIRSNVFQTVLASTQRDVSVIDNDYLKGIRKRIVCF